MQSSYKTLLILFALAILSSCSQQNKQIDTQTMLIQRQDYFLSRSGDISKQSSQKYQQAVAKIQQNKDIKGATFQTPWRFEGPLNVNGRVNILAIHPTNHKTWLVGESTGGIFKTINGGQSYYSVFDSYNHLAISEIVYHPKNHNIIFAGTGDENISGYPFIGDGVYKSSDGGETWQPFGLQDKGIISTICIHPTHTDTMYVASMGIPFVADSNRGVYRTYDAGASWQQILLPDTTAGVIDLILDNNNPQIIYAVGWNRVRTNSVSLVDGPQSKLYVSYNGGDTWQMANIANSADPNSRMGISQTSTVNNRIYASITSNTYSLKGVYYSDDSAQTWQSIDIQDISNIYSGFGWYFGQIRVNPYNTNKVYIPGMSMAYYNTNTSSWTTIPSEHADHHDLDFFSEDSLIASTDGGLFLSVDGGQTWTDIDNIPSTQFYRIAFNPNVSGEYWGGLQDNGTVAGGVTDLNNWLYKSGGDGFQVVFDRYDSEIVYTESQNGSLYYLFAGSWGQDFTNGIDMLDRRSWDMPYINDKDNNFYAGTQRVYKNTAAPTGSWTVVSPDLTDGGIGRNHVITALGVSEINSNYVYAGTADGNIWRSTDASSTWNEITNTLPNIYVTSIESSPTFADNIYVGQSGYRDNSQIAHIHKSTDKGNTWTSIAGNLPNMAVNAIAVLPFRHDSIIFVATDGGVYGTKNAGIQWNRVGDNMPIYPIFDLVYDSLQRRLLAGTYARGMYSVCVDSIIPDLIDGFQCPIADINLSIYPNPTHEYINIETSSQHNTQIEIFSASGKRISVNNFTQNEKIRIDIKGMKNGIYFVKINIDNQSIIKKIIKI